MDAEVVEEKGRLLRKRGVRPEQIASYVLGGKAVQGLVEHRRIGAHASTSPADMHK